MAAGIPNPEEIGLEGLFGRLQTKAERLTVARESAAARVGVERELGFRPLAPFGRAELRALALSLLVAGEKEHYVAVGLEPLGAQFHKGDHRRDQPALIVPASAAVEVAVFLDQLERVGRPVARQGFDDVHVSEDEDRLGLWRSSGW